MSMFNLTSENAFGSNHIAPDEQAVTALLKQPALSYIRNLRKTIDEDPNFLTFHDRSVSAKIQNFLTKQGILRDDDEYERQFLKVVMEALTRVRSLEK